MAFRPPRRFGKSDKIKGGMEIMSDVKFLVGIIEKIVNICETNTKVDWTSAEITPNEEFKNIIDIIAESLKNYDSKN